MKKQNKQTDTIKRMTIIFGYTLFVLSLITVIVSTIIPFGSIFFNPVARHFNVALSLTSLVAGAVLPPLISYLIGDRATHSKAKAEHHYNGVLFGITSYWLTLFFNFFGSETVATVRGAVSEPLATIINGWPILATLLVMATVAVLYVRSRNKQTSMLEYKPFQLVLFSGLIATFTYILFNQYYTAGTIWAISILYIVIPVILIGVSYILWPIKNYSSSGTRLAAAVAAVSIGFITASLAGQLISYLNNIMILPVIAGTAALALYLLLVRRVK